MSFKDKVLIIVGVAMVSLAIGGYTGHKFKQCPPDEAERISTLTDSLRASNKREKQAIADFAKAQAEAEAIAAALEAYKASHPTIKTRVKNAQRLLNDASFATVIDSAFAEPESLPGLEPSAR